MVLEKQKQAIILSTGENETIEMSLDKSSEQLIMQMFGKSLYSDAEGSIVREWTSNGIDSHRRANSKEPVVVSLSPTLDNNFEFTVEDFGTGLSEHEVTTVISQYGNSTKRKSNNEIGGWGIGFKSGLAYSSSFYFICRKDGIECKYMMYEGEFKNHIDLLYTTETTERNGVKMILPVKSADFKTFVSKIKEQLCYFQHVYFNNINQENFNTFEIFRDKDYQYSSLCSDARMHICLDDVYYPIDFQKLGISPLLFPIGLRFTLSDGIFPTPNRETIIYSATAKVQILAKIEKVANAIVKKYNTHVSTIKELKDVINFCNETITCISINNKNTSIIPLVAYATETVETVVMKGFKYLDFVHLYENKNYLLLKEFELSYILSEDSIRAPSKSFNDFTLSKITSKNIKRYLIDVPITASQKSYIKSVSNYRDSVFFIKHSPSTKLGSKVQRFRDYNYYNLLHLNSFKKELWRDVIEEYQNFIQLFINDCIKISDVKVPKEFLESLKSNRLESRKIKEELPVGEINTKLAVSHIYDCDKWKFSERSYNLKKFLASKNFIVYSTNKESEEISKMFPIFRNISFVVLNTKEIVLVDKLNYQNCISMKEFQKGNTKHFKRVVTAWLIQDLTSKYSNTFYKINIIASSSKLLGDNLKNLKEYQLKYLKDVSVNHVLKESMIATAVKNNLFDYTIYYDYLKAEKDLEKLQYVEDFLSVIGSYSSLDSAKKISILLNMLFKYNKQKLNIEHYNVKL